MEQKNKFPYASLFVLVGALVYIFSPLDIIPDMFLGLGQLDDMGAIYLAFKAAKSLLKYGKNKTKPPNPGDVVAEVTSQDSKEQQDD